MKVKQTFIRCPNCRRLKNANYIDKMTAIKVKCFCGTELIKNIKTKEDAKNKRTTV